MAECWSCGAERGDASFCSTCGKVQPVSATADFFAVLGISRAMRLDVPGLERAFRERSRIVHPDRFGANSPVERRLALEQVTRLNEAYRTLKDPQKRAEYLLRLEGVEVGREDSRTSDLELLTEMMELQESIDHARSPEALEKVREVLDRRQNEIMALLTRYFDDGDGSRDLVARKLDELRYVRRLGERLEHELEEMS